MDNGGIVIPLPSLRSKFRNELLLEVALFGAALLTAFMLAFGLRGHAMLQWVIPLSITALGAATAAKLANVSLFKLRLSVSPGGGSVSVNASYIEVPVSVMLVPNALTERTDRHAIRIPWAGVESWTVLPATSSGRRRSPARHTIVTATAAGENGRLFISREDLGPAADELLISIAQKYCPVALEVRDVSLLRSVHDYVEG